VASLKRAYMRTSRQPRWCLAFALLAAAAPCLVAACATGVPGSGILTGIVRPCTPADGQGAAPDPARVVTLLVQNQGGQTVATQRLPRRSGGVRYRMRLPAGPYSINASAGGDSAGGMVTVIADETTTDDFTGAASCV
jgi:hypothetical protein